MSDLLAAALAELPGTARVLDAGGWFIPLPRATHVVDLMPYETRRCVVTLEPLAGERFTRDTWLQKLEAWWQEMLRLSRPYSQITLR